MAQPPSTIIRTLEHEPARWQCDFTIAKYNVAEIMSPVEIDRYINRMGMTAAQLGIDPYEIQDHQGNALVYGGASAIWERLKGTGVTAFDNSNAYLGVGDSTTAVASDQTDLQASTNKFRKAMEATFPTHTDGTSTASHAQMVYKSSYSTAQANYAWNEWALFNASSSGRMLNRRVFSGGTKTSSDTWTLTVTFTLG